MYEKLEHMRSNISSAGITYADIFLTGVLSGLHMSQTFVSVHVSRACNFVKFL